MPAADPGKFNLQIDAATVGTGANAGNGGTTGAVQVTVGAHTVGETAGTGTSLADFTAVIGGDCAANGTITLAAGENKVCSVTNIKSSVPIVRVGSISVNVGATATVDVTASNIPASGLARYNLSVGYNKAVVTVASVLGGDGAFSGAPTANINNTTGVVVFSQAVGAGPTSGSVVIARLSVQAVGASGTSTALALTITELAANDLSQITPRQAIDGSVAVGPKVLQSIGHTTEELVEDGATRKKVWTTLRADGGTQDGQPATLPGGIRHVAAVVIYSPSCMTVIAAKASPPFATTSATIEAANGRVTLTVDIPTGTPAATTFPVDFGRLLLRLTGPATAPCPLTLTGSTVYQPDTAPGSATWPASAPATVTYRRGDVLGNGNPKSVAQAIAILQYLVSLRTIGQINPVNAASIRADPASTGPDNGDQLSTADAILVLRYLVNIVDDSYVAVP